MESGGESFEDREIDQWKTVVHALYVKKHTYIKHYWKVHDHVCDVRKINPHNF